MEIETCEQYVLSELFIEQKANSVLRQQMSQLEAERDKLAERVAELTDDVHDYIIKRGMQDVVRDSYAGITGVYEFNDFEGWYSDVFRGVSVNGVDRLKLKEFTREAFYRRYEEIRDER